MKTMLLVGVMLIAAISIGCGGSEDGSGTSDAPPASNTSATQSGSSSSTQSTPTEGASDTTSPGGSTGAGVMASQACRDAALAVAEAFSFMTPGLGGATEEDLEAYSRALNAARDSAPDDVRADIEVFAEAWERLSSAMADSNWNPTSGQVPPAALMQAFQAFDTPEVRAASDNMSEWFESNCPSN